MGTLARWDPWSELRSMREMMDHMLSGFSRGDMGTDWIQGSLRLDAFYEDGNLVVRAEVPGFKPEDIDVSIEKDILTIKAESKEEKNVEEKSYVMREYRTGTMTRSIRLPADVNGDNATASFENGVLQLSFPRTEGAQRRRIEVQAGTTSGQTRSQIGTRSGETSASSDTTKQSHKAKRQEEAHAR